MPVIINELEVITEAPPEAAAAAEGGTPPAAAQATPALSPDDVEAVARHQAERASRLYAG